MQKGIICKLTNEIATFETECPDFIELAESEKKTYAGHYSTDNELHEGLQVLSFCIPLAGAIIFFVKIGNQPKQANRACVLALAGVGFGIIFRVIITIIGGGF